MDTETIHVNPITYKLNMDDEELKKYRPFFKVSSGSSSKITKTIKHSNKNEEKIKLKRKEKGDVIVELWDRSSSQPENLIGRGEVKYHHLSEKEGKFEDWIPLYDRNNKEIGKALVEINIVPIHQELGYEDVFNRSIEDMHRSFNRAIEDMGSSFEHFHRTALPSTATPSLTSGMEKEKEKEKKTEMIEEKPKKEERVESQGVTRSGLSPSRRSLFDSTMFDMEDTFNKSLEDIHNTFEQFTRDFFPSGFRDIMGDFDEKTRLEDKRETGRLEGRRGEENLGKKSGTEMKEESFRPST